MSRAATVLCLLALTLGCSMERHNLSQPGVSQSVRVESGDRLFMDLEEEAGCRWDARCDDGDVEVRIKRRPGVAKVTIRIHRGYDGPSFVRFRYLRNGVDEPLRQFTVALYKRTGDCAFWE